MSDIPDLSHADLVMLVTLARLCNSKEGEDETTLWEESGASKPEFRIPEHIALCDKNGLVQAACIQIADCGWWIDEKVLVAILRPLVTEGVKLALARAGLTDTLTTCISDKSACSQIAFAIAVAYDYLHPPHYGSSMVDQVEERNQYAHKPPCNWVPADADDPRHIGRMLRNCRNSCRKRVRHDDDAQEQAAKK